MIPETVRWTGCLVLACGIASHRSSHASPASAALRARAFDLAYNLDHEPALAAFQQAIEVDPSDAAAHRGLASIIWLNLLFERGTVTVEDYLGHLTRPEMSVKPPPSDVAAAFQHHVETALSLSEQRVRSNAGDVDAYYQVGATVGLMASYSATVEGRLLGAFRTARRAYDTHERVLALDPSRKDAGLIVGLYRYVVSTLPFPLRWMAYVAGFGGGREEGLRMVEEAARFPADAQTDAKFALVLLYNRERRYGEAVAVLAELQSRYPRNRLLWLESGATLLRAGRPVEAEVALSRGMAMLERDSRPQMFGEDALWRFRLGSARVAQRRYDAAEPDLARALKSEAHDWVHGRVRGEMGRIALARRDRVRARQELREAVRLGMKSRDTVGVAAAERLLEEAER